MKIASAELVISAAQRAQFPRDHLPQIALCGRSNVGKSSLLNHLLQRRRLARTSSTPGKTRQLNFYRIQSAGPQRRSFYFVDLPGYGYAKVAQAEREHWRRLVEAYFTGARTLAGAVSIIDSRLGPTDSDMELLAWLATLKLPILVVATKADKLNAKSRAEMSRQIATTLAHLPVSGPVLFSALNGLGARELWKHLNDVFLASSA